MPTIPSIETALRIPAPDIGAAETETCRPSTATTSGVFLSNVLEQLGDLSAFTALHTEADKSPYLSVKSAAGRHYSVTLPEHSGPFEVWASVEMPLDTPKGHWSRLHEREEVLAQALQTTRLAWHSNKKTGWIGIPVALAANENELDDDLAYTTAMQLRSLLATVERISKAIDEQKKRPAEHSRSR